ncbi:pilus assembly protein [Roseomonas sp. JC162]|uniref:Pilus assembly protein n=1 Tax=Neoroseomonas marina TaxID=1232220 RepID=A0A848E9D3_9PROT|nr:pilus assembly protein [Neoroseomonas marina]
MSAKRHPLRCRRGASALEFALVGAIFFIVLLASIDLGRYYMAMQGLRNFVADAERYGIVNMWWDTAGTRTATCAQIVQATNRGGAIGGLAGTSSGNCVTRTQTVSGGIVTVTVAVNVDVQLRLLFNTFQFMPTRFQDSSTITFQL